MFIIVLLKVFWINLSFQLNKKMPDIAHKSHIKRGLAFVFAYIKFYINSVRTNNAVSCNTEEYAFFIITLSPILSQAYILQSSKIKILQFLWILSRLEDYIQCCFIDEAE